MEGEKISSQSPGKSSGNSKSQKNSAAAAEATNAVSKAMRSKKKDPAVFEVEEILFIVPSAQDEEEDVDID